MRAESPRVFISLLIFAVVLILSACATYDFLATDSTTTSLIPEPTSGAAGLLVIVHGANGRADTWPPKMEEAFRTLADSQGWDVFRVNWPEMSDRIVTAAKNGDRLGEYLGRDLALRGGQYRVLHFIGSSLGANVVHAMARGYRENLPAGNEPAFIQTTFLDPFIPRGIAGRYGRRHFGEYADYAESYFTRHEPVVGSNTPLKHAENYEMRAIVPEPESPHFTYYHDYPIFWYIATISDDAVGPGFGLSPYIAEKHEEPGPAGLTDFRDAEQYLDYEPGQVRILSKQ